MNTEIAQRIAAWDGKSSRDISAVYDLHHKDADFANTVIQLVGDTSFQKGATWLLKAWLEDGNKFTDDQIAQIYGLLLDLTEWESRLHVLQCMPFLPIGREQRRNVELFLRTTLVDTNKFIRAWSYNGFYELASQYPEYTEEVQQFFEMAMRDEAASVKARIRNIMKKGS